MFTWDLPVLVVTAALPAYFLGTGRLRRWHDFVLRAVYIAYRVVGYTVFGDAPVEAD